MNATGDLSGLAIGYLVGSTAGGTGRHVAMLASGCAARGATVTVYGSRWLGGTTPRTPRSPLRAERRHAAACGRSWNRTRPRA